MVGAARPSDLDEHVEAAMQLGSAGTLVKDIQDRLYAFVEDRSVIPFDTPDVSFMTNWYRGLPTAFDNDEGIPIGNIFWLWWICKAWGMYRYLFLCSIDAFKIVILSRAKHVKQNA